MAARKPMKYRQTMLFAATALIVMAIAATFAATKVNSTIAGVAEKQVIDLAEENTTRDALHIQSMVIGGNSMIGMGAGHTMAMESDTAIEDGHAMTDGADHAMAMNADGETAMEAGHTMTNGEDHTMAMNADGETAMEDGHAVTNSEDHTMAMAPEGSLAMESDGETAMEAGHTMTNGSGESMVMDGDGSVTLVAADPNAGASMQVEQSMVLGRAPLTLDLLTGSSGLPMHYSMLVEGLGVVESSLFDLNGEIVWSTNPGAVGHSEIEHSQIQDAAAGSVSHDLRGPLRTIDGFSKALIEDYDDKLDDQGKDFLGRVRAGTQRMGMLIDAMLQMSRASRGEMYREEVDFSEIVSSIATDLQAADPKRKVEFVIAKNVSVVGDQRLLTGVLQNLLSNAWKFTSKHPMAVIEFGTTYRDDKLVYFVRDDGAGFDMAYVHKLFGAFQRLHPTTEFEGTGVGLATAQRIIHRHGGQIWAEGAVDEGATFYFTL